MRLNGAPQALPIEKAVARGLKSSLVGIGFNLALALFKCAAGFFGHSFALVADGIESFSDVVSSTVVFFGLKLSIKPPDEDHPYGHGKAEPIAAIIVSLALIFAAILIGVESIKKIQEPHPLPRPYTLWVLLAVVCHFRWQGYRQHSSQERYLASFKRCDHLGLRSDRDLRRTLDSKCRGG
jgi:cation diffusion facilitator family transporter